MTFKQLRDRLNKLTDEQLDNEISIVGEDRFANNIILEVANEDYYFNVGWKCSVPFSALTEEDIEDAETQLQWRNGTPYLFSDRL